MAQKLQQNRNILGLDVGEVRVGVALAGTIAKIPRPVVTLIRDDKIFSNIKEIADHEKADTIVVGVPRNMSGQETSQSNTIRQFADKLKEDTDLEIIFADETLSSVR